MPGSASVMPIEMLSWLLQRNQIEVPEAGPETRMKGGTEYFDAADALARLASGRPVRFPAMEAVSARVGGRRITFHCNFEQDLIQNHHRRGAFYERKCLEKLAALLPHGARVVDIGANVGNHTLYLALFRSARVTVFEPNPLALAPLFANVLANGLFPQVDLQHAGLGVSDRAAGGYGFRRRSRNLGGARLLDGEGGIRTVRGDDVLAGMMPDLVKIDVEGMEREVLDGLAQTLQMARPALMVEVDNAREDWFRSWMDARGYRAVHVSDVTRTQKNFIAVPEAAEARPAAT